uniref:G-protein coupled receptors family 1 profile domain-containing protein n=1 Tax=Mycena chlorophos TaxID=658473 RepID=A0ABQ0MEQ6_MYCCL|nr:predicted protein [Mycena chlorophos]
MAVELLTTVFNALAASALVGLTLTILPVLLSSQIQRSWLWLSAIASWILYSASYLLVIAHQDPESAPPPRGLCALQMMAIYAGPPVTTATGVALLIDILFKIKKNPFTKLLGHRYSLTLLILPWALYAAVAIEALVLVTDFDEIQLNETRMYCNSSKSIQSQITAGICVVGLGSAVGVEGWIISILYHNWAQMRLRKNQLNADLRLSSVLRILIFTVQTSLGLVLAGMVSGSIEIENVAVWCALLPLIPVLCAITFGSQWDIVTFYLFWLRPKDTLPTAEVAESETQLGFNANHPIDDQVNKFLAP